MTDPNKFVFLSNKRFLPFVLFLILLIPRFIDFNATSITYDELAAKDSGPWWSLIKKGDFTSEDWAYKKPTLVIMRYFYGVLPEALFGSDPGNPYDLNGARFIGALLGAFLGVIVFLLGSQIGGTSIGLMAVLIYNLFPAILGHDRFASHDLPARIVSAGSLWLLIRYFQSEKKKFLWLGIFFAGLSFACYFRIGIQTIAILVLGYSWRSFIRKGWNSPETIYFAFLVGLCSFLIGVVLFVITWPYGWMHPYDAFYDVFLTQFRIGQAGGNFEYFLGSIREVPKYYYILVYLCTMPVLILAFCVLGFKTTWQNIIRAEAVSLLWITIAVPILVGFVSFRAALNHYLLICYPPTCVLAALGVQKCSTVFSKMVKPSLFQVGACGIIITSELISAVRIHPFYLEYFNALVGGTKGVVAHKFFESGWYGEAIYPLFDFVNQNAPANSFIESRLSAWPGLADLKHNLRPDLKVQGIEGANPLGADFVVRVGHERNDQFYRWNPNPEIYEKVHDVLAMGGSIGDVWRRKITSEGPYIYNEDFSSYQIKFAIQNNQCGFNLFSDGKIFPGVTGQSCGVLFRIPSELLKNRKQIQIRSEVQIEGGRAQILCGTSISNLTSVARCENTKGILESPKIACPPAQDFLIYLEMLTNKQWDLSTKTFWDYDWFDSLQVMGWP
jgi:hypothetical protein